MRRLAVSGTPASDRVLAAGTAAVALLAAIVAVVFLVTGTGRLVAKHGTRPESLPAAAVVTRPPASHAAPARAATPVPYVVCLDPGHGGDDLGTIRQANGKAPALYEKALTLRYALDLADRLRADGFKVVMTRTTDTLVNASNADVNGDGTVGAQKGANGELVSTELDDLQARINICNAAHADLLISIHFNGSDDQQLEGYEVWYTQDRPFGDKSLRFASLLEQELGKQTKAGGFNAIDRGVNNDAADNDVSGRFQHMVMTGPAVPGYVTPSAMPGVIGEPAVITNDADANFVASAAGRNAIVTAYERAVLAFFGKQ